MRPYKLEVHRASCRRFLGGPKVKKDMRFKVKMSGYIHAMLSIDFDDFRTWLCKKDFMTRT
jgi:hypothetical protein